LLSELRLPCLPQLRDFGEAEGRLYLVTDFIEGRALDEHCAAESLSLRQRVAVLARVAHALQSLHERRLIHRDIKPANILIGAHGDVVIVDLGIAALFGENATQTITSEGVPIGSPAFMSPEQARGERSSITTRSDVYSLGATAYRILTGSTPHDTDTSLGEAIRRVGHDQPRDPRVLREDLPRALAAVLRRCVAPDPRDRYPTAEAFAEDLQRFLDGDPVEAQPPSLAQRVGRFIGRHPIIATSTACAAVAVLTLAVTSALVWRMNGRPWTVRVDRRGSIASIVSMGGNVLFSWDAGGDGRIHLAKMVDCPFEDLPPRIVLLALESTAEEGLAGELYAVDPRQPNRPLWRASEAACGFSIPPSFGDDGSSDGSAYSVRAAVVADVFPSQPGDEIISVHRAAGPATALRITALNGDVLYQSWHNGHLADVYWSEHADLLFVCGVSNDERLLKMARTSMNGVHPTVAFTIRPSLGCTEDSVIDPWRSEPHHDLVMYGVLHPVEASRRFTGGAAAFEEPRHDDPGVVRLVLRDAQSDGSLDIHLDEMGRAIGPAEPTDQCAAAAAAGAWDLESITLTQILGASGPDPTNQSELSD
jgi:hypothetical protein